MNQVFIAVLLSYACTCYVRIFLYMYPRFILTETKKIDISSPVDFEHTVHVGFDPATGKFTVSFEVLLRVLLMLTV